MTPIVRQAKDVYRVLTPAQKRQFLLLQVILIFSSLLEVVGVSSIAPFIAVAVDPSIIQSNSTLAHIYQTLGLQSPKSFVVVLGMGFLTMVIVNGLFQIFTIHRVHRFSLGVGGEFAHELNRYYLNQDYMFFVARNSSELVNKVLVDTNRVAQIVLVSLLMINARVLSILFLTLFLLYINVLIALVSIVVLIVVYFVIFRYARSRVRRNGQRITRLNQARIRSMTESYESIKDIKLLGAEEVYEKSFLENTRTVMRATADNSILGLSPYYIVEMFALGGILIVALVLLTNEGGISSGLSMLGLYAMLGYRLVPSFQQAYKAVIQFKGAIPSFQTIAPDLAASRSFSRPERAAQPMAMRSKVSMNGIDFTYPGRKSETLKNVSMEIEAGTFTLIRGESGSGKSTLLDLLLGLLWPDAGSIDVDGTPIVRENAQDWQLSFGYVPQHINLIDTTVRENIAFGVPPHEIDMQRVETVTQMAGLKEVIEQLPQGYDTFIGQRGVRLSGGQRQRIGIARALYRQSPLLVLDEATSALDLKNENTILDTLKNLKGQITIIVVSHRPSVVEYADVVYKVEDGRVSQCFDSGDSVRV